MDLPRDADHRLEELREGLFTSDLSVNEFLLVKETGFHPLGFVMGSSIYHTGIQGRRWSKSQELSKLTGAMYNARELAMTRMEEEAEQLGADGVVGVRLDVNYYEWGSDAAEFIALGTAVKAEDGRSYLNKLGKPFTSDLSGQDFWTLMQTGYTPQGLVMGTCVYHIAHRGLGQTIGAIGQNTELPNFTQALYEARELAMTRMQDEGNRLGATGIVGVRLEEKSHQWGSHTIEFLSLGTAVTKQSDNVTLPRPTVIISLDN
ncbi:MAG: heavy metal-binding domain-containing protein [Acidimicrobiales bacterium]